MYEVRGKNRLRKQLTRFEGIQVKESGIAAAIGSLFDTSISTLKRIFPDSWQLLVALAYRVLRTQYKYGRLVYQAPLKNTCAWTQYKYDAALLQ